MVEIALFREWALSLPGVDEQPHFHMASFRANKKIFSTLREEEKRAMLKLSLVSQSVYCSYDVTVFSPVPGGWGAKGATLVDLRTVPPDICKEALITAYEEVTAKKPGKAKKR